MNRLLFVAVAVVVSVVGCRPAPSTAPVVAPATTPPATVTLPVPVAAESVPSAMPLNTYLATRPDGPTRFHLIGRLASELPAAFKKGGGNYWAVDLWEENGTTFIIGCVPKTSPDGQRLFELLKDSKNHRLNLDLESVGPDNSRLTEGRDLLIVKYYPGR